MDRSLIEKIAFLIFFICFLFFGTTILISILSFIISKLFPDNTDRQDYNIASAIAQIIFLIVFFTAPFVLKWISTANRDVQVGSINHFIDHLSLPLITTLFTLYSFSNIFRYE